MGTDSCGENKKASQYIQVSVIRQHVQVKFQISNFKRNFKFQVQFQISSQISNFRNKFLRASTKFLRVTDPSSVSIRAVL